MDRTAILRWRWRTSKGGIYHAVRPVPAGGREAWQPACQFREAMVETMRMPDGRELCLACWRSLSRSW